MPHFPTRITDDGVEIGPEFVVVDLLDVCHFFQLMIAVTCDFNYVNETIDITVDQGNKISRQTG